MAGPAAALLLLLAAAAAGEDAPAPPSWQSAETSLGPLKFREFGESDGPLVLCFHGMTDSPFIRDEWNAVAYRLAEEGFHVVVPDFHSAPEALQPGRATGDRVREVVAELAQHLGAVPTRYHAAVAPKLVVLGKSWGGRMAAEAAALPQVIGVGLVAPAISESQAATLFPLIHGEKALLMVRDDPVVPFDRAAGLRRLLGGDSVHWSEAPSGGHRVVEAFVAPLASFLVQLRGKYLHDGEAEPEL